MSDKTHKSIHEILHCYLENRTTMFPLRGCFLILSNSQQKTAGDFADRHGAHICSVNSSKCLLVITELLLSVRYSAIRERGKAVYFSTTNLGYFYLARSPRHSWQLVKFGSLLGVWDRKAINNWPFETWKAQRLRVYDVLSWPSRRKTLSVFFMLVHRLWRWTSNKFTVNIF